MTGAGELDRRLTLQAPIETDDGEGGVALSYTDVCALWAKVTPLAARADVAADSLGAVVRYRIVTRARGDITTRHQLQGGAVTYRVIAVRLSADRRFVEIDAEERQN